MSQFISQKKDRNGVVTLQLNRPEVHNAFNAELISELSSSLLILGQDSKLRAVVITGAGKSFSAGADIHEMRAGINATDAENQQQAMALAVLLRTLNYFPKPTIAKVNGNAFGGGVGLIACCDIAIAADTCTFGLTETRLGLVPAVISAYVVRRIGEPAARRYFLNGDRFNAIEAVRIGLIHELCPATSLNEKVALEIDKLLASGPIASIFAKQLVFAISGNDQEKQKRLDENTTAMIARLRTSDEGQEGLQAFLEKRRPAWQPKK
ncbi:MAG: enoyl-CoA hydratase-related protein [Xanthomonadales bacterium]|nr:enoyl-CoA hydratase-related protein [Xanthomonadales bacterium]